MHKFTKALLALKDEKYKEFTAKLVPDTEYEIIGVRVPEIRKIAKNVSVSDATDFLNEKHRYYEEFFLHGLIIANIKNSAQAYPLLKEFLPYIDNWAICDGVAVSVKTLAKDGEVFFNKIKKWLLSDKTYTVRFGLVCLLAYYTGKEYSTEVLKLATSVNSDKYYVNMAVAWLLSVMLVKNYEETLPLIESKCLKTFVQNKTIDKARDSFRITNDKKNYIKTLKI